MPQLFGGGLLPLRLTCPKRFAADLKGSAPKAKSATAEPATGSLTSATGVPATPENVEPTSLHRADYAGFGKGSCGSALFCFLFFDAV